MELFRELDKLGLEGKKAKVYLAVLEIGEGTVHNIAKKAGLKRTTTYEIIDQLFQEGLVVHVKLGKKTLVTAENPEKIKLKLKDKLETAERLLPELKSFYNSSLVKPRITLYEGEKGIINLYYKTIEKPNVEILAFTAVTEGFESIGEPGQRYINDRVKADIFCRVISPNTPEAQRYQGRDVIEKRKTKLVPAEKFPFGVEINIWDNKIAIMSYTKAEMIGVLIESKELYKTLRSVFELCWSLLPEYKSPYGEVPPPFSDREKN